MEPLQSIECAEEKILCLSLDWSNRRIKTKLVSFSFHLLPSTSRSDLQFEFDSNPSIVVSLSDGTISTLAGESKLEVISNWHAHDFEPWIAAFDCWQPTTVWTGRSFLFDTHLSLSQANRLFRFVRRW